jgi:ligand-binding sensor domain-containing protein
VSGIALRAAFAVAGLLTLAQSPIVAQQRFWTPEERILVGDGGLVRAVAAGPFDVYGAADFGIVVYDAARNRWKTPLPLPIEMIATRPSALAFDPVGGTLWLGTESGDLFSTAPGFQRWDRASGGLRGRVESIVAWPQDGSVYVFAGGEWVRLPVGSFFPERVPVNALPAGVQAQATRLPDDPWFRAASGTLGLDPRNRRWQLTDVAQGREPGEFWISTDGGGIIRYDTHSGRQDWLRYGLAGPGAGSIAVLDGTVWIGGDGRSVRGGVAWTDRDIATWGQQLREEGAPARFVAEIVSFADATWFGAEDGLFRLSGTPDAWRRGDWTRFTSADGLASDRVRSLAVFAGLLWAGTDLGLTPFGTDGEAVRQPLFAGVRVTRMAVRADTLFIATDAGLQRLVAGNAAAAASAQPVAARRSPRVRGSLADVVADDSLMFVISADGVVDVDGTGAPIRDAVLDRVGSPFRLVLANGRLWVAGPGGIAHRDPATRAWQAFTVPEDVPAGPVVDVVADGEWVWATTMAGAVRLRWQ